jgi:hypothetical protein
LTGFIYDDAVKLLKGEQGILPPNAGYRTHHYASLANQASQGISRVDLGALDLEEALFKLWRYAVPTTNPQVIREWASV